MSHWKSDIPTQCCVCHEKLHRVFVNMQTEVSGMEFPICLGCFILAEQELGPEIGQMYHFPSGRKLGG